jgi:hypothetical protein
MALPIGDVGVVGFVSYAAIREVFSFARFMIERRDKGDGKEKRCIEHNEAKIALKNNLLSLTTLGRIEGHLEKLSENSTVQVTLLRQLNGIK